MLAKVTRYIRNGQYGFVRELKENGELGETFFVHKNNIVIGEGIQCLYPRLYNGEYVEIEIDQNKVPEKDTDLRYVSKITGPLGHTLRCEEISISKEKFQNQESSAPLEQATPLVQTTPLEQATVVQKSPVVQKNV